MRIKKLTAAVLCAAMIFSSFTGCGKDDTVKPGSNPTSSAGNESTKSADKGNDSGEYTPGASTGIDKIVTKRAYDYDIDNMVAEDFVKALGIGWNLGNTLDATGGDGTDPIAQEKSWGNPEISQALIRCVADAGFTTIRIPVTWYHFTDPTTYKIDEKMLSRVKQVVDWSIDAGLFVIINIHHDNLSANGKEGWLSPKTENYTATQEQLCEMWTQIGKYFADYDSRLIFEGMNEPRTIGTKSEWTGTANEWTNVNLLGLSFVDTIRGLGGNNAKRFLMVPCYAATSSSNVWAKYDFPDDDRVLLSIHAYSPYSFALDTHGTKEWSSSNQADTRDIDKLFQDIQSILLSKGHYAVIGEFGAMHKNNLDARNDWAKYYATKAAEYGVPLIWWDNNSFSDGETFGMVRRTVNKVLFTSILEELLNAWYGTDYHFPADY